MSDFVTFLVYMGIGVVVCFYVLYYNAKHDFCTIKIDDIDSPMIIGYILMLPILAWPGVVMLFLMGMLGKFALNIMKKHDFGDSDE